MAAAAEPRPPGPRTLVVACGALAHELVELRRRHGWHGLDIQCLPAALHNRPDRIAGAVDDRLTALAGSYDATFVAYADCGTGGALDAVLARHGVERLPGAHCYEVFTGADAFEALFAAEPATFFLTDFLARHFDRLIIRGLGIDRHPQLEDMYFANYRQLVYLAQRDDAELDARAEAAAARLGLAYQRRRTGLGPVGTELVRFHDHARRRAG